MLQSTAKTRALDMTEWKECYPSMPSAELYVALDHSRRLGAGNDMLRMAAIIMAMPNNTGTLLEGLRPIRRAHAEADGDLAIILDAVDEFIRCASSNTHTALAASRC